MMQWNESCLKFKNLPDFETPQDHNKDNEYVLSVRAESTQGGEPTTAQIKVNVLNKVSEKLEILIPKTQRLTTPEGSDYALGFDLNETFSKSIPLVVELSGPDALHFRSMEGKLFYWNQNTGAYLTGESEFFGLQFTDPPNYEYPMDTERDNTYRVIVKISSFNGDFTDTIYLTVKVTDVAEAPLILQPAAGSHYVREGTRFALPFSARPQGQGLPTYSLGGEHAALFELEAEKGRVLFVNAPDFESVPRDLLSSGYDLRIIAEANGVESARDVRVLISDVNEDPSGFSLSSNSVPEDSSSGTTVGKFRSFDPEGGALSYTLEPANSSNNN